MTNDNNPLPKDLSALETRLTQRPQENSTPALRSRVLGSVAEALQADRRRSRWSFVFGLAAAVVIMMNLTLGSVAVTDFAGRPKVTSDRIAAAARTISELGLPVSPSEARRLAWQLAVAENLPRLPQPQSSVGHPSPL